MGVGADGFNRLLLADGLDVDALAEARAFFRIVTSEHIFAVASYKHLMLIAAKRQGGTERHVTSTARLRSRNFIHLVLTNMTALDWTIVVVYG